MTKPTAVIMGGIPATNIALFHKVRFMVGDPTGYAEVTDPAGTTTRIFMCRDIETDRARRSARADRVHTPAEYEPAGGLSGDRETATAQAFAELLIREGVTEAVTDRTLPYIYAHHLVQRGIRLSYDPDLGVASRRSKAPDEVRALRDAQSLTEDAMRLACETIARASADSDGVLHGTAGVLTADSIRSMIDVFLLERGASTPHGTIVACGPLGADCHHRGEGALRSAQPIVIDIFPMVHATHFHGDCTRTIVHGQVPEKVRAMHAAVLDAKAAAERAVRPGATGDDVHAAAIAAIHRHGFQSGMLAPDADPGIASMVHGTGHGIGLEVHEHPLLDRNGPALVLGDALTIEPGLYCRAVGGLRIEDMVIVTEHGCENLNRLPTALSWA